MEKPIQQPLSATGPTVISLRWSTTTMSGASPEASTSSSVRRVPISLSRCGVCTIAGSPNSTASPSWWLNAFSSSDVIESNPISPTATTPSFAR